MYILLKMDLPCQCVSKFPLLQEGAKVYYRGSYMTAQRYEINNLRVVRTIFYKRAQQVKYCL